MIRVGVVLLLGGAGCLREPERPLCASPRLLAELSGLSDDASPWLSADRLEILFQSDRAGALDIWRATRASPTVPFGAPEKLAGGVNTDNFQDAHPFVSADGRTLYFTSTRIDSNRRDLYTATRPDRDAPFGNVEPVANLESLVHPSVTDDGLTIYFSRTGADHLSRATRASTEDLFVSEVELPRLTPILDSHPSISGDGRRLMFTSGVDTGAGIKGRLFEIEVPIGSDLDQFGEPVPVEATAGAQPADEDNDIAQHASGLTVVFASDRSEPDAGRDLYIGCE